jgi:hypothetical protein
MVIAQLWGGGVLNLFGGYGWDDRFQQNLPSHIRVITFDLTVCNQE